MKHIRKFWRETLRPWWHDYEWPVMGALAFLTLMLGHYGFHLQTLAEKKTPHFLDMLFQSLQLFLLQASVQTPISWQLEFARWLAPAIACYTAMQALGEIFAEELQSFRLRFWSEHVIICGLGRKGLVLARGFLERGQKVVVVEQDDENDLVRQCRDLGGCVLLGDAAEPRVLRKAGVARATCLFALCGDDGVNAEVALAAAELAAGRPGSPLDCHVHIFDPQLCTLLRERELDAGSAGIRLEFFNTYELGARVLLEENPLPIPAGAASSAASPRIFIVGVGRLGESLLVNAARQWHTAGAAGGAKLRVTLVDRKAREIAAVLAIRYPGLKRLCELTALDVDVHSASFQQAGFLYDGGCDGHLTRVFVCLDDDSLSLSTALALVRHDRDQHPTIIVRMAQEAGLAVLLEDTDTATASFRHLRAFGLLDRTCHPDQILRGTHEILARAIHDDYLRQQTAAGKTPAQNPSMVPWDALPDHLKESNRQQADDIGAKLQAVHCSAAPMLDWDESLFEFTADEIERLAVMEHDRWMAAKLEAGWRHGPTKDDNARTHPSLIPYSQLPPGEQDKDRSAVRQIPALLSKVGFRVHRLKPKPRAGNKHEESQ
jgi:hypothetical protein